MMPTTNQPRWWVFALSAFITIIIACICVALWASGVLPSTHKQDNSNARMIKSGLGSRLRDRDGSGDPDRFNIQLRFNSSTSPEIRAVFENATARWQEVIVGDIGPPVLVQKGQSICGKESKERIVVDDIVIFVNVAAIDGIGGVLAMSGPCGADSDGRIRAGLMNFDLADLQPLMDNDRAHIVVLHEMAHVLGFGTLWESKRLIQKSEVHTLYLGDQGKIGNREIGGDGRPLVEDQGGPGTAFSHWKEAQMKNELMTGFVSEYGSAPLSKLTLRSMADLGYQVDPSKADEFDISTAKSQRQSTDSPTASSMATTYGKDVINMPIVVLPKTNAPTMSER